MISPDRLAEIEKWAKSPEALAMGEAIREFAGRPISAHEIDYEWLLKMINHNLDNDKLRMLEILELRYTLSKNYMDRMVLDTEVTRLIKLVDPTTYDRMQRHLIGVTNKQIGKI